MGNRLTAKKRWLGALMLVLMLIIAVIGFWIGSSLEKVTYRQSAQQENDIPGVLPTITYDGKTYKAKPNLTSILLIGYDMEENEVKPTGYRGGGQADFLLLMVIDHQSKTIYPLQIDRDTMTDVMVLGLTGHMVGTRNMQICLSHAYGKDIRENDSMTARAVSNLLQGETITGTISMRMSSIGALNHALGGVTVTLQDDFSSEDPAMIPGAAICLNDEQATLYVRSRMKVGDGTNASRMRRQSVYMSNAADKMKQMLHNDTGAAKRLLDALEDHIESSLSSSRLINEMNRAGGYDILPIETLPGTHRIGQRGFMEFYADNEAIMSWIIRAFYNPMDKVGLRR